MDWKSTALVSGSAVLAAYFAAQPPVQVPGSTAPPRTTGRPAPAAKPATDIAHEAARLHARLHPHVEYVAPGRNPFTFGQRVPPAQPSAPVASAPVEPLTVEAPPTPTLRIQLSGIAEDSASGELVRTAVISLPDDVLLVKVGDMVVGQYKVTSITADSVELTHDGDGTVVRLGLRP